MNCGNCLMERVKIVELVNGKCPHCDKPAKKTAKKRATLTHDEMRYLEHGAKGWFEPTGRGWRTCDSLVGRGLLEHNGVSRGKGERYRTTPTGKQSLPEDPDQKAAREEIEASEISEGSSDRGTFSDTGVSQIRRSASVSEADYQHHDPSEE